MYYGLGLVLFPLGDMSYLKELPEMYHECSHEEHDMTPDDFVFEHLFCLGAIMEYIEDDFDEENEQPHQPQFDHNPVQVHVTVSPVYNISKTSRYDDNDVVFVSKNVTTILNGFVQEVYHPPAV